MSRPSYTFKAVAYRPDAPEVHDDTSLEQFELYVPKKKPLPVAVAMHTPLNRLGTMTAEPLKPAVLHHTQATQTDPVVFADDVDQCEYRAYREYRAYNEHFAEEAARKEREALAIEQQQRAAEERRLAENDAYMKEFDSPAATELRAAANKKILQQHVEKQDKLKLEREKQPVKPVQTVKATQAPVRTRTHMPAY
jgi:hypothetical protein